MSQTDDTPPRLKWLSEELSTKAKNLGEQDVPHFFWILDKETKNFAYFAKLGDGDAAQIIEILAKRYGGEILDRVIDRMIAQDEYFDFPDSIDTKRPSACKLR